MNYFYSEKFKKNVWITNHAQESMVRRFIDTDTLVELIESGAVKYRDKSNLWIYKKIDSRADNLICAAVIEKAALIVKTVMVNWELE